MLNQMIGCNTLYRPQEPLDHSPSASEWSLRQIAACGYGAVEYSHPNEWRIEQAEAMGRYAQGLGLCNWSCHAPFLSHATDPTVAHCVAALRHSLSVAGALGAGFIVVHIPFDLGLLKPDEALAFADYRQKDLDILGQVLSLARRLGVGLALENGHTQKHMAHIMGLVRQMDDPLVGICVDTGHAALGDLGPAEAIRRAGPHLLTTHLQDNLGQRDDHLPPGSGAIDWPDVIAALQEVDYRGVLMLELTDNAHGRPYDQECEQRAGKAFVESLI